MGEGRGRDARIQAQKIRDRTSIRSGAAWADGSLILHQKKQIGTRGGRHGNPDGAEHLREKRIQHEGRKLSNRPWAALMLKVSFEPVPIISSLISGLPRR